MGQSIAHHGFKKLVLLVCHGGNAPVANLISREVRSDFKVYPFVLNSGAFDHPAVKATISKGNTFDFHDSYRVSAGGWYLPNYNNFRSYFSRIVYRYGAFYEKGNLEIAGNNINKVGISAGVMLPFKTSSITRMSGLEIGVELGKRGTTKNNLINQNFVNLRVGFNFADRWFRKSLYN